MEENAVPVENTKMEDNIKAVVEALLFSSEKPLMVDQIRKVLDNLAADQIKEKILELKEEYERTNRGMRIFEVAGGYQMITSPVFATFLRKLYKGPQSADKLSKPALETLAIIAYKQPLSKLEIESLRKVNVDGVITTLMDKNLIRITGRKKAPGRPKVYGTSREFLEYFGLKSLEELPKIDNFPLPQELQESQIEETPKKEESDVPGETAQTN